MKLYLLIIAAYLLAGCQTQPATLPTRAECITGVEFELDGREQQDISTIKNAFTTISGKFSHAGLAGFSINGSQVYFQFRNNCADRGNLTRKIIDSVSSGFSDFPHYRMISDPITPSSNTIDLKGPDWSDTNAFPLEP